MNKVISSVLKKLKDKINAANEKGELQKVITLNETLDDIKAELNVDGKDETVFTQADDIRAMTDEEIAKFMTQTIMNAIGFYFSGEELRKLNFDMEKDEKIHLDWLKTPAGEKSF